MRLLRAMLPFYPPLLITLAFLVPVSDPVDLDTDDDAMKMATTTQAEVAREIDAGGPIEWRSLHEAVTARLRDLIAAGELAEGSRIVERELCDQLGVSRTPLREAFRCWQSRGWSRSSPTGGGGEPDWTRRGARHAAGDRAAGGARRRARLCQRNRRRNQDDPRPARRDARLFTGARNAPSISSQPGHPSRDRADRPQRVAARDARAAACAHEAHLLSAATTSRSNWAAAVADHEAIMAALERRDGEGAQRIAAAASRRFLGAPCGEPADRPRHHEASGAQ